MAELEDEALPGCCEIKVEMPDVDEEEETADPLATDETEANCFFGQATRVKEEREEDVKATVEAPVVKEELQNEIVAGCDHAVPNDPGYNFRVKEEILLEDENADVKRMAAGEPLWLDGETSDIQDCPPEGSKWNYTSSSEPQPHRYTDDKYKCTQSEGRQAISKIHTGKMLYSCNTCDFKCSRSASLKAHMRAHRDESPYSSSSAGDEAVDDKRDKPVRSKVLTNSRDSSGLYPCDTCDYRSASADTLKIHMRSHTGERPYPCNFCDYKGITSGNLKIHMRTHTGDKPYSCDICGYKFTQSSHLARHMKTHSRLKPFSCDFCSYKCRLPHNLKAHVRRHTGEKPYSCRVCGFKCSLSTNLKSHMRTHTGEPY